MTSERGNKTPQSKALLMKRLRAERKAAGLVSVELWTTPTNAEKIKRYAESLKT